jgi:hypothetical protein
MTEERKHAILFAATILSARRIQESITSDKPDMAKQYYIDPGPFKRPSSSWSGLTRSIPTDRQAAKASAKGRTLPGKRTGPVCGKSQSS